MPASSSTTLAKMRAPDPTGTAFLPRERDGLGISYFYARESDPEYDAVRFSVEAGQAKARANNAKALRHIGMEILSEPRLSDPNVRYARDVHRMFLTRLRDEKLIDTAEYDAITEAFDLAVEHAALAVAAAWLRERGSIPIPSE